MLVAEPNSVCADTMTKTVFAYGTDQSYLYIPKAFTPNGDGKNDFFVISGYNRCLLYHVDIFNRWGQKVFETSDISVPWDGTFNGKLVEEGTYVYIISGGGNKIDGYVVVLK